MGKELTFTPVFEETETAIKERIIGRIPDKWRKQPGDFIHDAAIPSAPEIQQIKINQDFILKNSFALFADGIYLDYRAAESNIFRYPAKQAKGQLKITAVQGTVINKGYKLTTVILDQDKNPIVATVDEAVTFNATTTRTVNVTTTGYGKLMNVPTGSEWVLSPPIPGVQVIEQTAYFAYGTDIESDESLRNRWKEQRQKTRRSGNKQDYIAWALEVTGVGMAKCVPLWAGKGTVKVIIANVEKQPASPELVQAAQQYIDPDQTGEGDGVAPVGAIVTVESATNLPVDVAATLMLADGSTLDQAVAEFTTDLISYLDSLAFKETPVVYTKIASILGGNKHVADYSGLTINGDTVNLVVDYAQIPTAGVVTFS